MASDSSNQGIAISTPNQNANRQWRLKRPIEANTLPGPEHFDFVESSIPEISNQQILLRTLYLGTSPAQRSYISQGSSMHDKVAAGDVMRGRGIAMVEKSYSADCQVGEIVSANLGWQDYSVHDAGTDDLLSIRKLNTPQRPYSLALGILGSAGLTAYFGLLDVGNIQAGDTVLISAAAGGVGSCAVQIAKRHACRVIGIAGGADKCRWLEDTYGISTIDYKNDDIDKRLQDECPEGVNVFFDNVGGTQLDTALAHLAIGARVVICGYISTDYISNDYISNDCISNDCISNDYISNDDSSNGYSSNNYASKVSGPKNYVNLLSRRASMQGFFVFDYLSQFAKAEQTLQHWFKRGELKNNCDVMLGLENMPAALQSLFTGQNIGVRLCQVALEPVSILKNN